MTEYAAYVRQLEKRLRLEQERANAAQDANFVLSVACMALVILLVMVSNPV